MRTLKLLFTASIFLVLSYSCSTTQLMNEWKNPEVDSIYVSKILIVGMSPNLEARKEFEKALKKEYESRGVEAVMSLDLFDPSFTTEKKTEKELKEIENKLTSDFFDAVLFTKIIGVDTKTDYAKTYKDKKYLDMRFEEDYLNNQEIYYNPKYYTNYKVYNAETSLYCICPTKDRQLVWKGYIDIVDPTSINETVKDYVNLLVLALEQHEFIPAPIARK